MSKPVLVIKHLHCKDSAAQTNAISKFRSILPSALSRADMTKFALTVPRTADEGSATDLVMVAEYAQSGVEAELGAVDDVSSLAETTETYRLAPAVSYTRPNVDSPVEDGDEVAAAAASAPGEKQDDKPIIFANFGYQAGKTAAALEGWADVVSSAEEHEPGTLSYSVMDDGAASFIRTIEVYKSEEFLRGTHMKGPAIARNQAQNGAWRTGEVWVLHLKKVDGYFLR